ncbi:hypothetical protein CAEBREN_25102 [Caenorhabditis brenneri]|uniref:Uncharacterized protein n=1 Tax=Caenorhabditis brenneri TaxID=135651 RepID=G0NV36_CAEBE|nr:hypothetical protein CAEBREN_25102 [Caenorhabditis brenneri]
MEERRRAAKLAQALEEPFMFNSQNRMMAEYELQLTPMDNDNGFDFINSSPAFPPTPVENGNLKSEDSPTEPRFPELIFHGDDLAMTELPSNEFRITERIKMETDTVVDIVSSPGLSIRLVNPHQSGFMDASFVDGTKDQQNPALLDNSSAATQSHLNHSELHSRTTPSGIGSGT